MPRSNRNRPAASSRPHSCWVSRGIRAPLVSQMVTGAVLRRSIRATGTHTSSGTGWSGPPARLALRRSRDSTVARRCPSSSIARLTSTSVVRRATRWSVTVRVSLSRRMWLSRSAESRNDSPIAAPSAFWRGGAPGTGTLVIA